jgi:hypothetical protein
VDFANNRLWGTLSADLVIHPKALKDPRIAEAVERAIARLRYGAITVNSWTGFLFAYGTPPWGAYPGSAPANIQSGTGWVHNTSMLENVEKAVPGTDDHRAQAGDVSHPRTAHTARGSLLSRRRQAGASAGRRCRGDARLSPAQTARRRGRSRISMA